MTAKIAVILSGCGFLDGSEIHEAVLTLLALDNAGAQVTCCAPNVDQKDVINHLTQQPMNETRNVLVESARIARGKIRDLKEIRAADFDGLVMPGGYGAAKNLCTYAFDGLKAKVNPEVERVVRDFVDAKKPVAAICIAPVLMAALFGKDKNMAISLTIGTDEATAGHIRDFGAEHTSCLVRDFVVDKQNKVVTTPAYMLGKGPAEVYTGIDKAVRAVLELAGS